MMNWKIKLLTLGGVIATVASASNAQLVNGNFSADTAPTSASATGWTAGGFGTVPGLGGVRNDSFSISGNYYYLNEGPGFPVGLSQVISLASPANLSISGQYASRDFNGGSANPSRNSFVVRVLDAGGTNSVLYEQAFGTTALGSWTNFAVTTGPIATSSVRVMFVGQENGFDDDYMIDNLTASAVPEPGTIALLVLALLPGRVALRRRK